MSSRVAELREYWEQLQTSPVWEKFRLGEEAWENKVRHTGALIDDIGRNGKGIA